MTIAEADGKTVGEYLQLLIYQFKQLKDAISSNAVKEFRDKQTIEFLEKKDTDSMSHAIRRLMNSLKSVYNSEIIKANGEV